MKKHCLLFLLMATVFCGTTAAQTQTPRQDTFAIKGFHVDLRIQVMKMSALKKLATRLREWGINTLLVEWADNYPFKSEPLIPGRYAYTEGEIRDFTAYCNRIGLTLIPLQETFGHMQYVLRHEKYAGLREDKTDFSQVCPLKVEQDNTLFVHLLGEIAKADRSPYLHIGGDETRLLGHDKACKEAVAAHGVSALYMNYTKMICNITLQQGKRPVLWADMVLKHPEALTVLPPQTVLMDWNYGWKLNHFGAYDKILQSGLEIWGAGAIRSSPDDYFLTCWQKHFENIRHYIPEARKMGFSGIFMTSWSTSGIYAYLATSSSQLTDLYAIRHVYPITGFSMLIAAYAQSLSSLKPLDIPAFVHRYSHSHYGFDDNQATLFWKALTIAPYQVVNGKVVAPFPISLKALQDSARYASRILHDLRPEDNRQEYAHYCLMADLRLQYLSFQRIQAQANADTTSPEELQVLAKQLKDYLVTAQKLDKRYIQLNKDAFYVSELETENRLRNKPAVVLWEQISKSR